MAGSARTGAPIPYSLLDLAPVCEGSTPAQAFANSLDLARHAEALGYTRYWLAEHHNMPGIASAATALLIGHIAGGTSTLRVGAGGVMLPNHAPLQVAEQFGTLASLYPGRIDLGLGRAPGTDQATLQALRRHYAGAEAFPSDVMELLRYFEPVQPGQPVQAVPGAGLEVPVWILGSSLFGAQLAAARRDWSRRRSMTSRRSGRRRKRPWSNRPWPARWSAMRPTCAKASPISPAATGPTN